MIYQVKYLKRIVYHALVRPVGQVTAWWPLMPAGGGSFMMHEEVREMVSGPRPVFGDSEPRAHLWG